MSRRDECPDLDDTLYVVRDNLGKADAFIAAAERLAEQPGVIDGPDDDLSDDDNDPGRLRNNLAHLIESTKLAIRAAQYAGDQMALRLDAHRAESSLAAETTAIAKRRGKE